ncbi:hypothetical protein TAC_0126 [Acinetobacter phage TAC1]|nr:hypothetical protein TAC_0126 [Acinetobacter phage TAC1]
MNRKQRKIKKMIARFHTGHTAITPIHKLLGKDCLLRPEYHRGSTSWHPSKILAVDREYNSVLIYCPRMEKSGFGHDGGEFHRFANDVIHKDIDKLRPKKHGCWWVDRKDLRVV